MGNITFWKLDQPALSKTFSAYTNLGHSGELVSFAFNPNGLELATGTTAGVRSFTGAIVSKDGKDHYYINDESVHILNVISGQIVASPVDHTDISGSEHGIAYIANGKYIIIGHERSNGEILIINAETRKLVDKVYASTYVLAIERSIDSKMFAVASGDAVEIWALN